VSAGEGVGMMEAVTREDCMDQGMKGASGSLGSRKRKYPGVSTCSVPAMTVERSWNGLVAIVERSCDSY
jgi:hypothetical protein